MRLKFKSHRKLTMEIIILSFYFDKFEHRKPPEPLAYSPLIELTWQFIAVIALILGGNYIRWRWEESINYDALWFSID